MHEIGYTPAMAAPRLNISSSLRQRMSYPKAAGGSLRMLVLESRYWLDDACARAAVHMGWTVRRAPVVAAGLLPRDQIAHLLESLVELRPDFILTINHSGMDRAGLFANLFADLGVPLVTWFVDDPRTILMNDAVHATPSTIALSWERRYLDYLHSMGFETTYHLPLAADTTRFQGIPCREPEIGGAFVGNSMIEFAQREWAHLEGRPELASAVTAAFEAGRVTREHFANGLEAMLHAETLSVLDEEARRHAEMIFFIEGTKRLRHSLAERLVPEGMQLRGDAGWQENFPNAGPPVNYEQDLAAFYRACAVNVNTTSIQMATAVNQRVFDAPAAGGFVLTDDQADASELFEPGPEIVWYSGLDDAVEKYRRFTTYPGERIAIIQSAQRRIADQHTYQHRLQTITGWIRDRFGN